MEGDIVREVNVNIVIENSDPAAKLEWPGNIPKCPDCLATNYFCNQHLGKTFSWFSGYNWHKTTYHLDW